jgi:hypothetical protein
MVAPDDIVDVDSTKTWVPGPFQLMHNQFRANRYYTSESKPVSDQIYTRKMMDVSYDIYATIRPAILIAESQRFLTAFQGWGKGRLLGVLNLNDLPVLSLSLNDSLDNRQALVVLGSDASRKLAIASNHSY